MTRCSIVLRGTGKTTWANNIRRSLLALDVEWGHIHAPLAPPDFWMSEVSASSLFFYHIGNPQLLNVDGTNAPAYWLSEALMRFCAYPMDTCLVLDVSSLPIEYDCIFQRVREKYPYAAVFSEVAPAMAWIAEKLNKPHERDPFG